MSALDAVSRQQLIQQALGQIGQTKTKPAKAFVSTPPANRQNQINKQPQALQPTFETVEQARLQAGAYQNQENPRNQANLNRLNQLLDAGEPLRGDVPRGYYLNLEI